MPSRRLTPTTTSFPNQLSATDRETATRAVYSQVIDDYLPEMLDRHFRSIFIISRNFVPGNS
jgi:hypothetical protein